MGGWNGGHPRLTRMTGVSSQDHDSPILGVPASLGNWNQWRMGPRERNRFQFTQGRESRVLQDSLSFMGLQLPRPTEDDCSSEMPRGSRAQKRHQCPVLPPWTLTHFCSLVDFIKILGVEPKASYMPSVYLQTASSLLPMGPSLSSPVSWSPGWSQTDLELPILLSQPLA